MVVEIIVGTAVAVIILQYIMAKYQTYRINNHIAQVQESHRVVKEHAAALHEYADNLRVQAYRLESDLQAAVEQIK